jgi:hypothetical protein
MKLSSPKGEATLKILLHKHAAENNMRIENGKNHITVHTTKPESGLIQYKSFKSAVRIRFHDENGITRITAQRHNSMTYNRLGSCIYIAVSSALAVIIYRSFSVLWFWMPLCTAVVFGSVTTFEVGVSENYGEIVSYIRNIIEMD